MASAYIDVEGLDTDELITLASDVEREVVKRRTALIEHLEKLSALAHRDIAPTPTPSDGPEWNNAEAILAFADEHGDAQAALHFNLANHWAVKAMRRARDGS